MIVGHGDIARVLPKSDLLFFASGVSNSQEEREAEYTRERDLLLSQGDGRRLVYFGSLCIFYSDSRYAVHKLEMERLVRTFPKWTILRLGNITWGNNPHTLINHLKLQHARGEELDIQNVYRYVCDKEEFLYWVNLIPDWNCEMNVPGRRMKVKDIVSTYVVSNHTEL